eukprot:g17609.t1
MEAAVTAAAESPEWVFSARWLVRCHCCFFEVQSVEVAWGLSVVPHQDSGDLRQGAWWAPTVRCVVGPDGSRWRGARWAPIARCLVGPDDS